jgi:hypothetical protein
MTPSAKEIFDRLNNDELDQLASRAKIVRLIDSAAATNAEKKAERIKTAYSANFATVAAKKWVLKHLIALGEIISIVGAPFAGKSGLITALVIAIAQGLAFRTSAARPQAPSSSSQSSVDRWCSGASWRNACAMASTAAACRLQSAQALSTSSILTALKSSSSRSRKLKPSMIAR